MDLPIDQEEIWAREIKECQVRLQLRVEKAIATRHKTKRKLLYQEWREKFGDDLARESAKFAEKIISGQMDRPKWFDPMIRF